VVRKALICQVLASPSSKRRQIVSERVRRRPLAQGEEAVPTTSPGLMKRVQEARDHLLPFLTSRREEVPEPLRGVLKEALDALNDTYGTFVIEFSVIYGGLDSNTLSTLISPEK
jgi:hypothetical protein